MKRRNEQPSVVPLVMTSVSAPPQGYAKDERGPKRPAKHRATVCYLNEVRKGPSTLTSFMPSGMRRSHSFQLSMSTLSS